MSKTIKGSKGPGFDYWDRIANSGKWAKTPGKFAKKCNKRKLRRSGKKLPKD